MRAVTPFRYLVGHEEAARDVVSDVRPALVVGLLFVASAALAREYDGQDLVAEPVHLVVPFLASLAAAVLTFLVVWSAAVRRGGPRGPFLLTFARWLALFWWTAPLAWAYAVPWERVLSPADAAVANLVTLGIVAAWRVVIMAWAGALLFGAPMRTVVFLLLGVSAPVVIAALNSMALPLVAVMGGVRQVPESERVVGELSRDLLCVSVVLGPILMLQALLVLVRNDGPWVGPTLAPASEPPERHRGAWAVAGVALLVGLGLLAVGQPEQARAHAVDRAVALGRTQDALRLLAAASPDDLPPQWGVPPREVRRPDELVRLLDLVEATRGADTSAWVRRAYAQALCHVDYSPWGPFGRARPVTLDEKPPDVDPLVRRTVRALASLTPEDVKGRAGNYSLGWWLETADPARVGDDAALSAARALFGVTAVRR